MHKRQRPDHRSQRVARRLFQWAWDSDHDDRVPNAVNATFVIALVVAAIGGATLLWLVLGSATVFAAAILLAPARKSPTDPPAERGRLAESIARHRALRRDARGQS